MRRLAMLYIGISLGSIIEEYQRVWRNPSLNHPPCTFVIKKKGTKKVKRWEK
jgi:hypothetical protein